MKKLFTLKFHCFKLNFAAVIFVLMFVTIKSYGQISITSSGTAFTQNFDGIGSSGTAALPSGWKVSQGTIYSAGTAATTVAYGTSGTGIVTGTSGGGTINWANGVTATSTDRSVGFLTTGSFTSPRNLYVQITNNSGSDLNSFTISYDIEKYRSGSRAFTINFFSSTDGTTWISQAAGDQAYAADANNTVISNPPLTTAKSVTISGLTLANGSSYYLRWSYTGTGGSTNGQGLGIDNFSISGSSGGLPPPTLIADISNNDVDHNLDISFTNDANWLAAVTSVKVNGTALTSGTDYNLTAGNLQLIPSVGNTLLTTAGTKTISIEATGYNGANVSQIISAGSLNILNSTVTLSSALSSGVTRTITMTAKDKYSNPIPSYQFMYNFNYVNNDITTNEAYIIDAISRTASIAGVNVTSLTNASGVSTFSIVMPAIIDANDGLTLQVLLNDATTNIGNLFSYYKIPPEITITGVDPATSNFYINSTKNILYRMKVDVINDTAKLSQISAQISGSYSHVAVSDYGFRLYYSSNATLDASDILLDSLSSTAMWSGIGETLVFNGHNYPFLVGTAYLFLTANFAVPETLNCSISGGLSANSQFIFAQPSSFSTGSTYGSLNSHLIKPVPVVEDLVVPQYMGSKTTASANNARTPIAVCVRITNLLENTAYEIRGSLALTSEASTIAGAGNTWNGTLFSTAYPIFTTDASGNTGPVWLFIQLTGNATRFDAGQVHNLRITFALSGSSMPSAPYFISSKTITALDIATSARTADTLDDGAFLKGTAHTSVTGKYVLIYDNVDGIGDPLFSYQVRNASATSTTQSELPAAINDIYLQSGTSSIGDYPAVFPIHNSNGVKRIEARNADNTIYAFNTDADGVWSSGANTNNATRRSVVTITNTDAPLVPMNTLNLNLFLEGLFDNTTNTMLEAKDINWGTGEVFPKYEAGIADKIDIDLYGENPPYTSAVASFSNIDLSTAGLATLKIMSTFNGNYYIRVRNRNHLEVWSAVPVPFNNSVINYNFTTNATNAFQAPGGYDPQFQVTLGIFALYLGDLDHSLGVDFDDFNLFEPYLTDGTYGFTIADFNGNGLVDFDDFNMFEPRLNLGPFAQYPGMPKKK